MGFISHHQKLMKFPKIRTIRLKGKAYTKFRQKLYDRAGGRCERCGNVAPLYVDGGFDEFLCGHVHHLKSKGAGGQDIENEVVYLCFLCHRAIHDGKIEKERKK